MTRIQNPNTLGACHSAKGKRRMTTRSKQYHIDFSTFSNTAAIIQDIRLLPSCIDSVYCVAFDAGSIHHKAIGGNAHERLPKSHGNSAAVAQWKWEQQLQ
jgi:hypothetical protein